MFCLSFDKMFIASPTRLWFLAAHVLDEQIAAFIENAAAISHLVIKISVVRVSREHFSFSPICLEIFHEPLQLPCQHSFCKSCLERITVDRWGRCKSLVTLRIDLDRLPRSCLSWMLPGSFRWHQCFRSESNDYPSAREFLPSGLSTDASSEVCPL